MWVQLLVGLIAVAIVLWLSFGNSESSPASSDSESLIDPEDATQIGVLLGLMGGTVTDAAVARYALQRFEATYHRKPTMRDAGTVVGLMRTM